MHGAGTSRHRDRRASTRWRPATTPVIPDRVVAGDLPGGGRRWPAARSSSRTAGFDHMEMFVSKLRAMGVEVDQRPEGLRAASTGRLTSVDVATLPYPGVATDYKPLLVTMLAVADGVAIVTENLFEGRFRYVDELRRMGADIRTEGHHAVVRGVPPALGRPGPGARHPGRRRAGAGRAGRRRRDRGHRRPPPRPRLRGLRRRCCASLGADVGRGGEPGGDRRAARPRRSRTLSSSSGPDGRPRRAGPPALLRRGGRGAEPGGGPPRLPGRAALRGRPDRRARGRQVHPRRPAGHGGPGGWPAVDARRLIAGAAAEPVDQVAVLAIDPTSPFTGGAILGDRVRMQRHATRPTRCSSARWPPGATWAAWPWPSPTPCGCSARSACRS